MIASPLLQHAAVAAFAALAITWPGMVSAWAQSQPRDAFSRTSPSGSYLAARHADGQRDAAAAASYYRAALRGDPGNNELLGRTFLAVLANGEVDEGVKLAGRVLQVDKNDSIARLVLGVRAIKQKQYPVARRELVQSVRGPITDLAATLLSAWTMANPSEAKRAADSIDKLAGADWYAIFKELHAALILDVAGQKKGAARHYERSYKLDPTALRVVQSYGSFLSRQGNNADALKVFAAFEEALPRHPLIVEATNELKAGKKLPFMVNTPQAGAAEVLYGLGAALGRRGGRISASSTCSFHSISRPRIRSPCCRSATSTRR
jgi:tetratricopeptide (TPR) repeat protein